ncbi:hypothetical protein Aph02nite_48730 [Actinoplanes philippinensis]|uniref:Transglutaminase-like superfamily protein n=1 Tax=Actinoplanes philippinensis TaxID=35752 RepID=A0A1I2HVX8_9ACTN|nr:transglutaminase domain-containing protein [Actinoplanes philippinensis]GIE78923.1 hypothetical protein Aph02nite_48730 [Actinoplanes philippinensis]SFF34184.1 Transglutaminase-like superfamily protein [Actinoplanes philippinensis]
MIRLVVARVLVAVACFASGLAFVPVLGTAVVTPVLVAVTVPLVATVAGTALSLALLVPAGAMTLSGSLGRQALTAVPAGFWDGWGRLLATTPPAYPDPAAMAVPFGLVWIATTLALRATGSWWAALPAVVPLLAAVPLSTGTLTPGGPGPAILLVAALITARFTARGHGRWPAAVASGAAVVAVALIAVPLPVRDRIDPRDHLTQAGLPLGGRSPLDQVAGWLAAPETPLFHVDGPAAGGRLRLAALDTYDGLRWSSAARYRRTGPAVPPGAVTTVITVDGLRGHALPAPAGARLATGDGDVFAADPSTGLVLSTDPLHAGFTYRVASFPPPSDAVTSSADIAALTVGVDDGTDPALRLPPGTPPEVLALTGPIAAEPSPGRRATLLAARLRTLANRPSGEPGHSPARLAAVLTGGAGSAEQIVPIFVLAARRLGLPARIVVGFDPPAADPGGVRRVRAGDVAVWPEVRFDGVGWVALDPLGVAAPGPRPGPPALTMPAPSAAPAVSAEPVPDIITTAIPPAAAPSPGVLDGRRDLLWLVPAVVLALLLGRWIIVAAAIRLRRRRRRAGPPADSLAGAFADTLDTLARAGYRAGPGDSHRTVHIGAAAVSTHADPEIVTRRWIPALTELAALTRLLDRGLFAAHQPTAADAATAWRHAGRIRDLLPRQRRPTRLFNRIRRDR